MVNALVKFYRLAAKLDSTDPDIVNVVVIRMSTTLEQVGRHLWKLYLDGHPNDETIEIVISPHGFDSVRHMTAAELVASSRNISNTGDLRSIFDKCGLGRILDGEAEADARIVMGQRNMVVHGTMDADADMGRLYTSIEGLIRRALSHDEQGLLMMYVAKATVAEMLDGGPFQPDKCHEDVVMQSKRVKGGDQAFTLHSRGHSLGALGRNVEALEAYDAAVGIDPADAAAHAGRGGALAAMDRVAEALEAYDRAADLDPGFAPFHLFRGGALAALGRDDEALEAYDAAVGIDPADAAAHAGRGGALAAMDRVAEALEAYDRAADLDPGFAPFHLFRGGALAALGRDDEALEAYDRAAGIDPLYAEAQAGRGDALAALGRDDEAQAAHETASRLSSSTDHP